MNPNISKLPGIYIHIPFCQSKCGYCDFFSITDHSRREDFISALRNEISLLSEMFQPQQPFDTIYFGGGTPSLLTGAELASIIDALHSAFSIANNCETTLEANPVSADIQNLRDYRSLGVNRISLGAQSFRDAELKRLGRLHSAAEANLAIKAARSAGFENMSLDLIFAAPEQSLSDWEYSLREAIARRPEHISAYNLTIEQGTPFHRLLLNREIRKPGEELELQFLQSAIRILRENGYAPYEISNYAVDPSRYSRHNCKYWDHTPYIGLGPSAHSFWDAQRHANVRSVAEYIARINEGHLARAFSETIDAKTMEFESILLSLRTYSGLDLSKFRQRFQRAFTDKYAGVVSHLTEDGLAEISDSHFCLTSRGMAISDSIIAQFQ
jgi:oxygen-independent coproporphyrinogen-3 oxidase